MVLLGRRVKEIIGPEQDIAYQTEYSNALNRLYYLIRQEKPNFKKLIDPRDFFRVYVAEPQQSFERIRAQSGAFLLSAFHERFEQHEVLRWNSGIRFTIISRSKCRKKANRTLLMNCGC